MQGEPSQRLLWRPLAEGRTVLCAEQYDVVGKVVPAPDLDEIVPVLRVCNRPFGHDGKHCDHLACEHRRAA